jgi:hypothetical protein
LLYRQPLKTSLKVLAWHLCESEEKAKKEAKKERKKAKKKQKNSEEEAKKKKRKRFGSKQTLATHAQVE